MTERVCIECGGPLPVNSRGYTDKRRRTCSDRCRKRHAAGGFCVDCGVRTSYRKGGAFDRCRACAKDQPNWGASKQHYEAMPRYLEIEDLWHEGYTMKEIAARVGISHPTLAITMHRMRRMPDFDLPYRYAMKDRKRIRTQYS